MKYIIIALAIIMVGCTTIEKAPAVAVDASVTPPNTVTISLPNWPMLAYSKSPEEAFVLLVVKDPKSFPLPKEITFNRSDGTTIVMPMLQPDKKMDKPK